MTNTLKINTITNVLENTNLKLALDTVYDDAHRHGYQKAMAAIAEFTSALSTPRNTDPEPPKQKGQNHGTIKPSAVSSDKRRNTNRWASMGLSVGDVISFRRKPQITATLGQDGEVLYRGKSYTLYALTKYLCGINNLVHRRTIADVTQWTYNGKLLNTLRAEYDRTNNPRSQKKTKRHAPHFEWKKLGIPNRAILTFKSNPKVKVKARHLRSIEDDKGIIHSLGGFTRKLYGKVGSNSAFKWTYNGKCLGGMIREYNDLN